MEKYYETLNQLLVNLFNDILYIEEKALLIEEFKDISITDMHIIEAIGVKTPKNMSTVAKQLNITVGTLTIAINNLVKKGYVKRTRSEKDRRVVLISLDKKGKLAYLHHLKFHKEMINDTIKNLNDEEIVVFTKALSNITEYFNNKYK
ncbi:DNA-binding MarR family transcriptional regulator [Natranaerovirga hydrolytica]|uniref:DNA-binding MarR family transcriptional regulator n=1 Tax=Natranaerovirga hydrolytica TaxID=680378 RepID=A0A4R1N1V7_9FIRM|nr:MarR family transcriptional regulator [Natranaerovirga hydrolytica]TCL00048.1 DNA-binding MarR family transcriptional regulator [Natranaerovirga hydrolytica]